MHDLAIDDRRQRPLVQPPTNRGMRLIAALAGLWADPLQAVGRAVRSGRDVVAYEFGSRRLYLINGPELVWEVLRRNKSFVKPPLPSRFKLWFGPEGLVGPAEFRSMALPAFERRRVDSLAGLIDDVLSSCLARFDYHAETQKPLNVSAEAMRLSLIVSSRALFGVDARSDAKRVNSALDTIQSYYSNQPVRVALGLVDRVLAPGAAEVSSAAAMLRAWVGRIMASASPHTDVPTNLLEELLQVGRDQRVSSALLCNIVMAALLSSYETTGCALAWTLICLAAHPRDAERMASEAASLPLQDLNVRDLAILEHTRRVFKESLRLYPPSWVIVRETLQPQVLDCYHVRARSTVLLSPYWIHRHASHWREPERFDPDRFDAGAPSPQPGAYVPFGAGPHGCFGERFAELVAQIVLARFVGRYRLRLASTSPMHPRALISLKPPEDATIVLTSRRPSS